MRIHGLKKFLAFMIAGLGCFIANAQTSEYLARQADGYLNNKQFYQASLILQQLQRAQPADPNLMLKRAIVEYEINNLDTAAVLSQKVMKYGSDKGSIAQYLFGKILMSRGNYSEAAIHFKLDLNHTPVSSDLHQKLIDEIKRCGSGEIASLQTNQILVESAGTEVNTIWDEINPIFSINSDSRFYFNSNREAIGTLGNTNEGYEMQYDMYGCNLSNGEWSDIGPLNEDLNTKSHELLVDFDEKGRIVYYKRGDRLANLKFVTDTFNQQNEKKMGVFDMPFILPQDEVFFFVDSIAIISSSRPGGLGGSDLYYSIKQSDHWSEPVNLGSVINTAFDEVSPFLAFDGRTLIFSSNNPTSIGGYDLFTSIYDDRSKAWSLPVNMGFPINSAEDEKYFRLNKNRLSGLFASNRKTGVGGVDIYFAYFNQAIAPQLERSRPVFFGQVIMDKRNADSTLSHLTTSEDKTMLISPVIYYESDEQLSLPSITKQMDIVAKALRENNNLNLNIEVFSDHGAHTTTQNLLFSLNRAESIKEYFTNHGVKPSQLFIKGMGSNFPVATESINGKPNPAGISLNKRIEFTYFQNDPGMELKYNQIKDAAQVNLLIKAIEFDDYSAKLKNLNYKVLLVSASNPANLEPYIPTTSQTIYIEKNNITGKYELMTDIENEYLLANKLKKNWISKGYEDAVVVAYIDNSRIAPSAMIKWAEKYPDLSNYIYRSE